MKLKNRIFVEIFREKVNLPESDVITECLESLRTRNIKYKPSENQRLSRILRGLLATFKQYWKNSRYDWKKFLKSRTIWLNSDFDYEFLCDRKTGTPTKRGRKEIPFNFKSVRSKQEAVLKICSIGKHDVNLLLKATIRSGKKAGKKELALSLQQLIEKGNSGGDEKFKKMSSTEAVALLIDADLSQKQYHMLRMRTLNCGVDIIPPYRYVQTEKKNCLPLTIEITATKASVRLQSMQNHTAKRIIDMKLDEIESYMSDKKIESMTCTLKNKCGFDGSSSQSRYNQQIDDFSTDDSNIYAITTTPLVLESSEFVVWKNPCPSSVRFCRPLSLEFVKETKDLNVRTKQNIDMEIESLENFVYILPSGKSITMSYELYLTMVDGKVVSHITNQSSFQRCTCCSATPKQMNQIENLTNGTFDADPSTLAYGISPLHCWIRSFETVLHISYRLSIKKWQVRTEEDKLSVKNRKLLVQAEFVDKFNMRVDMPTAGGSGNSNTGNVARRAFSDPQLLSTILNIDCTLLTRLYMILIAISCEYTLDPEKFKSYCHDTFKIYLQHYDWFPTPSSFHRLLIHGAEIAAKSPFPLGMMSEEAAEARNKFYRNDRQHHARKTSREDNLRDVFTRQLVSSDPIISDFDILRRQKSLKKKRLPKDVRDLLLSNIAENENDTNELEVEDLELEMFPLLDSFVLESTDEVWRNKYFSY